MGQRTSWARAEPAPALAPRRADTAAAAPAALDAAVGTAWQRVLDRILGPGLSPCQTELVESERWAAGGPYPATPLAMLGSEGKGAFSTRYRPEPVEGAGVLDVLQSAAVSFKDTLVLSGGGVAPHPDLPATPGTANLAASVNAIADPARRTAALARYQWTAAEKAPWISDLRSLIERSWSGRFDFFLNKPRWEWLGARVAVALNIGERPKAADDHLDLETYKTPSGESLNTFDIANVTGPGSTTDAFDQTMRLSSTNLGPNSFDLLREHVEFEFGSDRLTPAATGTLDGFVTTFNGAIGDVAHQEIHVDIVGHASGAGSDAYNLDLSRRRAVAVREYLRSHGFANVDTRVTLDPRGEAEADASDPRRAGDQRVDLSVDGGERQVVAVHEFGHEFGLGDEYGTVGSRPRHDAWARDMTDASGAHLPGAVREHNGGIMSFGNAIRPRHYAAFHHALQTVTAQSPWALGERKPKWQVRMECGLPSPPGDFPLPARDGQAQLA